MTLPHPFLMSPVLAATITGVLAVIGIYVGAVLNRQHKTMAEVKEQVANSHSTNLRHDVDRVIHGMDELKQMAHAQATALNNMRLDMGWERRERIDLAGRVSRLEEGEVNAD